MNHSFIFSSNSLRLTLKNWIIVLLVLIIILSLLPVILQTVEKFNITPDYRIPYNLSNDYWLYKELCKKAVKHYPVLIIGDSVIWGQYVSPDNTLSHYLNKIAGFNKYVNMGIDGLHPAAMLGLIKYYGKSIINKKVILHLNPLWMSSKKLDLREDKEFPFQHPHLVHQFSLHSKCNGPSLIEKTGIILERNIPFINWMNHIKIKYFNNKPLPYWTIQYPTKNPFKFIDNPKHENRPLPMPWFNRGIKKQKFEWINISDSFQWTCFKKTIKLLISGKNKVIVMLGPFNPYMQTEESLSRYNKMKKEMEKWFIQNKINYLIVTDLSSPDYADASHPIKEGYVKIAEEISRFGYFYDF